MAWSVLVEARLFAWSGGSTFGRPLVASDRGTAFGWVEGVNILKVAAAQSPQVEAQPFGGDSGPTFGRLVVTAGEGWGSVWVWGDDVLGAKAQYHTDVLSVGSCVVAAVVGSVLPGSEETCRKWLNAWSFVLNAVATGS